MIQALLLLFLTAVPLGGPVDLLVLRDGHTIPVLGPIEVEQNQVIFHQIDRKLYSLPLEEIDFAATRQAVNRKIGITTPQRDEAHLPLKVTEAEKQRLLRELEENHSGIPAPATQMELAPVQPPTVPQPTPNDEWAWKRQAQQLEESVRRAKDNLELLKRKEQNLQDEILGLLSVGYRPNDFSYQTFNLQLTREQIPQAALAVEQAQRALDQFRDNARRQGVLPGWLR
ncbi:MAG: hypothetical protein WBX15_20810 [Thermoanaerobaculia bacterium]